MSDQVSKIAQDLVCAVANVPGVRVNREEFLKKELGKFCNDDVVNTAIHKSMKEAMIPDKILDLIAEQCISYETLKVTAISAAAGFPGGLAMLGTIPADTAQFYAHIIRLSQKLAYIYGWDDLFEEELDDGTKAMLMVLIGVALGVNGASSALGTMAKGAINQMQKKIMKTAITKTTWYPLVKKVAQSVGVTITKKSLTQFLSKSIPVIGSLTSAGVTYATFMPMAKRLKKHLKATY